MIVNCLPIGSEGVFEPHDIIGERPYIVGDTRYQPSGLYLSQLGYFVHLRGDDNPYIIKKGIAWISFYERVHVTEDCR